MEFSEPSDGGWGWLVMFVGFMVGVIMDGISFSFGILFTELLEYFGRGKSLTSWVISVFNGATLCIGPVANVLVSRYGAQRVSVCSSILASIAVFVATYSPNVYLMILLYGFIAGSGLGVIYFASIVMIGRYFSKKRGLALGLAYCGSGVGGFLFAPLMEFLIAEYSWQGAVWVVSAIVLNCVPFGALLKPLNTLKHDETPGQSNTQNQSECSFIQEALNELKLFKTSCFIIYGASCFLCAIGFYVPFTFLPDFAGDMGMTPQEGAILISIIGITNTVGRATAGWLIDRPWVEPIKLNMGWLIGGGVATIFVTKYTTFIPLSIYCGLFGLTIAVFITCQPIISLKLADDGQMASFYGMVCFLQGVASLIGAPLAGMLADTTGNYAGAFYMAGATVLTAGAVCPLLLSKCLNRDIQTQRTTDEECVVNSYNVGNSTHL